MNPAGACRGGTLASDVLLLLAQRICGLSFLIAVSVSLGLVTFFVNRSRLGVERLRSLRIKGAGSSLGGLDS